MKPSRLKILGWSLLCLALPNVVYNIAILKNQELMAVLSPAIRYPYSYSAYAFGFLYCISLGLLVYAYRKEPRLKTRVQQIGLLDLLAVSILTAILLIATPFVWLHWGLLIYIPAIVAGLLVTAYRNIPTFTLRFLYGVGTAAWWCGCLGVGFCVSLLIQFSVFGDEPIKRLLQDIYSEGFLRGDQSQDAFFQIILLFFTRSTLLLPSGLLLCALIRAMTPKTSYKETI